MQCDGRRALSKRDSMFGHSLNASDDDDVDHVECKNSSRATSIIVKIYVQALRH